MPDDDEREIERCKRCEKPVVMMCQRFTGYCCAKCEEEA